MDKCPVCGASIQPGTLWCPACHTYVLNPEVGRLASSSRRLLASIIDYTILPFVLAIAIVFFIDNILGGERSKLKDYSTTVFLFIYLGLQLYEFTNGRSVGKMLLNMQIVGKDGKPANLFVMLLRETVGKLISSLILGLGYLWIIFDREKQGWHDKIFNTYVVKK